MPPDAFYEERGVRLTLRREVVEIDPEGARLWDDHGEVVEFGKLLMATGSRPRFLGVPGEALAGVRYFRSLEDYLQLRRDAERLQHVLVFAGGYVGLELAPTLRATGLEVTLVHPNHCPMAHVIPHDLGKAISEHYQSLGIETLSDDLLVGFAEEHGVILASTRQGNTISTQLVLADAGTVANSELAEAAGLLVGHGIEVDEFGRTTAPNVYAAGDVAEVPVLALEKRMRIESAEHAVLHGRLVGANMAGGTSPYEELPAFEANFPTVHVASVGEVGMSLNVESVWQPPFERGMIFYQENERLRGAVLWNTVDQLDWAREQIRSGKPFSRREIQEVLVKG